MGLFNPNAVFLSDVNLLLQLAILVILVLGFSFKRRSVYLKHGVTMGIAVALHTLSIFAIMVPSLLALTGSFENLLAELVIFSHAVLGGLVELLGLYLVITWVSHHQEVEVCLGNKKFMKPTMIMWLLELALGIIVYILLYVPI